MLTGQSYKLAECVGTIKDHATIAFYTLYALSDLPVLSALSSLSLLFAPFAPSAPDIISHEVCSYLNFLNTPPLPCALTLTLFYCVPTLS